MIYRCRRYLYNWKVQPAQLQQTYTTQDWKSQELRDCKLSQQILEPHSEKNTVTAQCKTASCLIDVKPTLSQVWKQDELISAICVQSVDVHMSCSSHGISELAPFFIDP